MPSFLMITWVILAPCFLGLRKKLPGLELQRLCLAAFRPPPGATVVAGGPLRPGGVQQSDCFANMRLCWQTCSSLRSRFQHPSKHWAKKRAERHNLVIRGPRSQSVTASVGPASSLVRGLVEAPRIETGARRPVPIRPQSGVSGAY